ncbi:hypothetical protein MTO96_001035 [Rhipicephalus appendiculatus]
MDTIRVLSCTFGFAFVLRPALKAAAPPRSGRVAVAAALVISFIEGLGGGLPPRRSRMRVARMNLGGERSPVWKESAIKRRNPRSRRRMGAGEGERSQRKRQK